MQLSFYWQLSRFHQVVQKRTIISLLPISKPICIRWNVHGSTHVFACLFIHQKHTKSKFCNITRYVRAFSGGALCLHHFRFHEPVTPNGCRCFFGLRRRLPWHFGSKCEWARAPCKRKKANKISVFTANLSPALITLFIIHSLCEHQPRSPLSSECVCVDLN